MKKYTLLGIVLFAFLFSAQAQVKRCFTDEKMQELFKTDPAAKQRYENMQRMLDERLAEYLRNPAARLMRTEATYSVPVVVHIAIPNPDLVTNAVVQSQLDTLNWYYGNQSATDSLRVYTPFRTTFGRSAIRFCLAQRDPNGLATIGIERKATPVIFNENTAHPSALVPAWNTQLYLNLWVVNVGPTSPMLGYSFLPGSYPSGDQRIGFVVNYQSFGSGASYLLPGYNLGKTAVHEIGHFFNLNHPWSDASNAGSNTNCTLDDGCTDTPPTNGPTYGCPSNVPVLNPCSPVPPGIMWQNHMDYADDACMVLFTQQQALRMNLALTTASDRSTLINSNGCQALVLVPNDAGINAIIAPTNGSITCTNSSVPQVTLQNYGANNLTSVSINVTVNGVAQTGYPYAWTGNLATNGKVNLTLPAVTLVAGTNTIVVTTSQPNGVPDGNPTNDVKSIKISYAVTLPPPLVENFSGVSFPPPNWIVLNPDGDITWKRNAVGNKNPGSAFVNTYNYASTGQMDDLVTPFIRYSNVDSVKLNFDLAASTYSYPGSTTIPLDTLEILASKDCGASFTTVYKKWGIDLQTLNAPNDPQTTEFFPVSANQWRTENVDLSQYAGSNQIALIFRVTNNYENNIFIDNVNLRTQTLPTQLKQQGYVVYPTAFQNSFGVWHYQTPTTLSAMNVYNSAGQLVWSKQFRGNADRQMTVDLTGKAAGMYLIELRYTDATLNVTQKVVKY